MRLEHRMSGAIDLGRIAALTLSALARLLADRVEPDGLAHSVALPADVEYI